MRKKLEVEIGSKANYLAIICKYIKEIKVYIAVCKRLCGRSDLHVRSFESGTIASKHLIILMRSLGMRPGNETASYCIPEPGTG